MNTKLLKQKILDLAIRGKLTQQLKSDGTAADLLTQISDERRKTRDERKGTRSKKSGVILSEAQSAKSKDLKQIIPLDKSEAPFEIPANWEWVCIDSIASLITDGEHLTPRRVESFEGYYLLSARNIQDNAIHLGDVDYVDDEEYNRIAKRCNPRKDDVLISCSGSIGRVAVVKDDNKYVMVRSAAMIRPVLVHSYYLMYALQSNCLQSQIQNYSKQTAQANLFQAAIRALQIPLPPLAEQQRIVAKIEEAFAEIEAIEKNKELLKTHIKQTRQKILDLAIHGKLVPQNKSDEPASVLLERITRDNPHYEKIEDEPFEIPENWIWARINDINFFQSNTENPMLEGNKNRTYELYSVPCFEAKYPEIVKGTEIGSTKVLVNKGDVLISKINPHLNRVWCVPQFTEHRMIASSEWIIIRNPEINQSYLVYVLQSGYFLDKMLSNTSGVGGSLTRAKPYEVKKYEIPLPPLAEQSRIVAKIEELFSTLDQMERNLV